MENLSFDLNLFVVLIFGVFVSALLVYLVYSFFRHKKYKNVLQYVKTKPNEVVMFKNHFSGKIRVIQNKGFIFPLFGTAQIVSLKQIEETFKYKVLLKNDYGKFFESDMTIKIKITRIPTVEVPFSLWLDGNLFLEQNEDLLAPIVTHGFTKDVAEDIIHLALKAYFYQIYFKDLDETKIIEIFKKCLDKYFELEDISINFSFDGSLNYFQKPSLTSNHIEFQD